MKTNKGEAETLAGFILEISGSFPKRNSKINFENYVFTIEALDKKRIKRLKSNIAITITIKAELVISRSFYEKK